MIFSYFSTSSPSARPPAPRTRRCSARAGRLELSGSSLGSGPNFRFLGFLNRSLSSSARPNDLLQIRTTHLKTSTFRPEAFRLHKQADSDSEQPSMPPTPPRPPEPSEPRSPRSPERPTPPNSPKQSPRARPSQTPPPEAPPSAPRAPSALRALSASETLRRPPENPLFCGPRARRSLEPEFRLSAPTPAQPEPPLARPRPPRLFARPKSATSLAAPAPRTEAARPSSVLRAQVEEGRERSARAV